VGLGAAMQLEAVRGIIMCPWTGEPVLRIEARVLSKARSSKVMRRTGSINKNQGRPVLLVHSSASLETCIAVKTISAITIVSKMKTKSLLTAERCSKNLDAQVQITRTTAQ
jgi:hypothetical protein